MIHSLLETTAILIPSPLQPSPLPSLFQPPEKESNVALWND